MTRFLILLAVPGLAFTLAACTSTDSTGSGESGLSAECSDGAVIPEAWVCPNDLSVECENGGADPELIFFTPPEDRPEGCDDLAYTLNDEGPFEVGTHDIVIRVDVGDDADEPGEVLCEAKLTVEDTEAPEGNDEPLELWPPNHKFHTIEGADCVQDRCDGDELTVTFSYASSDEPVNAKGDGNTEPDILLECDRVQLRSERQGPSNGRVYRLGYKAVDSSGNETEGECVVAVPHDQSGREAIDDGAAYRVELGEDECDDGAGGEGGAGGAGGEGGAGWRRWPSRCRWRRRCRRRSRFGRRGRGPLIAPTLGLRDSASTRPRATHAPSELDTWTTSG